MDSFRRQFLKSLLTGAACIAGFPRFLHAQDEGAYRAMPKIDSHFHIRNDRFDYFDRIRDDGFRVIAIAVDHDPLPFQFECIKEVCKRFPEQVVYVTSFPIQGWDEPDWVQKTLDHLNREFDAGAIGVKVWKNIGMVFRDKDGKIVLIDDPKFDPIIQLMEERDKTLIAHMADPRDSWLPFEKMRNPGDMRYFKNNPDFHMFLHPEYPSYERIMEARDSLLINHPKLRFVGAHLASIEWDLQKLSEWLDRFPHAGVDMAGRVDDLQLHDYDELKAFVHKYHDRLLYATDLTISKDADPGGFGDRIHDVWMKDWNYLTTEDEFKFPNTDWNVKSLGLPKNALENIYHKNAEKWFPVFG